MSIRIGAQLLNRGSQPAARGIGEMARRLERAGFDSLWLSDHVVMTRTRQSRYPFRSDGEMSWDPEDPWYDALVAMAFALHATEAIEVGIGVLVAPLREPIATAKQLATLDALSGGRVTLGVGAGWYAEEFAAIGVPFEARGRMLEEWVQVVRGCWTGTPASYAGEHFALPDEVVFRPRPSRPIQVIVGGNSGVAMARAGAIGNGWMPVARAGEVDSEFIARGVAAVRAAGETGGVDDGDRRVVLRLIDCEGAHASVARRLPDLAAAGVTDVVVEVAWQGAGDAERVHDVLRAGAR